jgi:hypothetical protein
MPVTSAGWGPATVGLDADKITYCVWDKLFNEHGSFDNLYDAINEAMRLNHEDQHSPTGKGETMTELSYREAAIDTALIAALVEAATDLVQHDAFDPEYLSADLNAKLTAVLAALAKLNGDK